MANKNQNKKALLPEKRFPEFCEDGEWNRFYANKLFAQINDKDHNGDLPVLAITQEHGAIPRALIDYNVSVTQSSIDSYKIIRVGDFIISLRSFQGGIEYSEYEGICSPAYVVLREKGDTVTAFFKHFLKSKAFIRDLTKNLEGLRDGKMISYKQFSEVLINLPSKPEQQKIADCLGSLDDLIAVHSTKLDALQDHKKGLLEQLFPAEGKTAPVLRFPEFENADEWNEMPLENVFTIFQGFAFSSKDSRNAGVRWLKIADVGLQSMNPETPSYLPTEHKNEYKRFRVSLGDFVVALTRPFLNHKLKIARVDSTYDGALLNQRVGKLLPHENADFVYYILQTSRLIAMIEKQIAGNDPPNLSSNQICDIPLRIPKPEEQQKIADCLSDLDGLITAQTEQIAALKEHKKGLMQQLFPNSELSKA
jgi:type I restriction enzyme S subunit